MVENTVIYEKKGRVAYITINRPNALNALSRQVHDELSAAFLDFRDDTDLWVALLTGAGDRAFSAGADVKAIGSRLAVGGTDTALPMSRPLFTGPDFELWKPVVAAIHGYCLGAGAELAMACDIIVAADNTEFGIVEGRLGYISGSTMVHRLARQVPLKQAAGMVLTGTRISAAEGYRIGLFNEVSPRAQLMETAERWVNAILACAPLVVQATKNALVTGLDSPLRIALSRNYPLVQRVAGTEDAREGITAFREKRQPVWRAR
jgi:dehydration protein DpgD